MKKLYILIGIVVVLAALLGAYLWWTAESEEPGVSKEAATAVIETEDDLSQTVTITKEGGVVRAVDILGVAYTLRVPAGAVETPTDITLAPLMPNVAGIQYGVAVKPDNLALSVPAQLSYNWYVAGKLGHHHPYKNPPFSALVKGDQLEMVFSDRALATKNFISIQVTGAGTYGVSNDPKLAGEAAREAFDNKDNNRLVQLNAALTLLRQDTLKRAEVTTLRETLGSIATEENPDVREVYIASVLENELAAMAYSGLPRAHAYGSIDGYLQFRCKLKESTYEDVVYAMKTAQQLSYDDVAQVCLERAHELLIERGKVVNGDKSRPLIDAVEVLQQMQLIGTDELPQAKDVVKKLSDDISASFAAYTTGTEAGQEGDVRSRGASADPLLKHNSRLMEEMLGVTALRAIGVDSFDEKGLKEFGDRMLEQTEMFVVVGEAACDLMPVLEEMLGSSVDEIYANMGGGVDAQKISKSCADVKSGKLNQALDMWETEVDELAEGVGDIQAGKDPNENWDDTSKLDAFMKQLGI